MTWWFRARYPVRSVSHSPEFRECEKGVFKTVQEKEKMLVTTMFSNLIKLHFNLLVIFILWSANTFNLDQSKILLFGIEFRKTLFPVIFQLSSVIHEGVLCGSVVKCLTRVIQGFWLRAALNPLGFSWKCPSARHFRAPA